MVELTKADGLGPNGEKYCWYQCTVKGGREGRPMGAVELAKAVQELGSGEILLNCIDKDGESCSYAIGNTVFFLPASFSPIAVSQSILLQAQIADSM